MQFPVRSELEISPAVLDKPVKANERMRINSNGKTYRSAGRLKLGWTIKETIGQAVVNTRGVAAGKKSIIVGE
jgi:hypothetical protein